MRQNCYFDEPEGKHFLDRRRNSPASARFSAANSPIRACLGAASSATILVAALVIFGTFWVVREGSDSSLATPSPLEPTATRLHPVTIVVDATPPRVATGTLDAAGNAITVRCGVCHATKPANPALRAASELDLFHQGLEVRHGDLSCLACHDPSDYDRLRSASGETIAFADRQQLCAQCHGPTARDYEHGAHGGMTGHWDLSKGPRTRLGCTQCHDPHAPAYPAMSRTFFSIDRFAEDSHDRR